jgi:fermentation-respiration switch protein FrsA (DUF1100 family)
MIGIPMRFYRIARLTLLILGTYAAIVLIALFFENKLVYPASVVAEYSQVQSNLGIREVTFKSADGTLIHARYAAREGSTGAILVSHGNGGNIDDQVIFIRNVRERFERPVLVYDYPGYGRSGGAPSETGCYDAGEAAHRWLVETQRIPANRILLLGHSLGGGVTIELSRRVDSEAMFLVSTFENLPKAAKARFFFLPCEWLMANRFESVKKLPGYRKPVFISHGDRDATIPYVQAERLYEAANAPKRLRIIEGGNHNDAASSNVLVEAREFFERECPK